MIQKIKRFLLITVASSTLLAPAIVPALASTAFANNITDNLCQGTNAAANGGTSENCTPGTGGTTTLSTLASKVVNIFSLIVGIVAVIMIIYGGFRYITSGGDSGSVGNAKNTLIYAIVGLIIVALAQFIVHYVLNTTTTAVGNQ
jgi:energy-converting hydrogenase Eha subunit B